MSVLQLRRYQRKGNYQAADADLDAVAASGIASAWTAYTPTVTATTGAYTTVSATGRYLVMGKLTHIQIKVTITTNGTAGGSALATLPNTTADYYIVAGREQNVTGKMLLGLCSAGLMYITDYNFGYPGGSGYLLMVSGIYENT